MEFTVQKSDLVRELGLSQGALEKKTTIPILSNVLVEAQGDRVYLTATDLEMGIRVSCPAKVKKPGSATIPAKRLLDYVRLLPESEVQVKVGDNHWANITCGRSKTRLAGMSRESYPELPEVPESPEVKVQLPIKLLSDLINRTIFAISMEESRFTLNGSLMLLRKDSIVMVSTDSHRLALVEAPVKLDSLLQPFRSLLPRRVMNEILKLANDAADGAMVEFVGDDNHMFLKLGDRQLMSRKLSGNFPDYERVLPKEQPNHIKVGRDALRSSIERVVQFTDEKTRTIKMTAGPDEMKLQASLSDQGESEESIAATYNGPEVSIGFNGSYLLDF